MSLVVKDLTIAFGGRQVAAIDKLTIQAGRVMGLVGESGSGKSMTANAMIGLAKRMGATVTGRILLDGVNLVELPEKQWREVRGRKIAMIFQSPSLAFNPVIRVGDLFLRTLRLHGERSREQALIRAEMALRDLFLVPGILRRYPLELSGGQLQRVAIAIAIALRAEFLIADEPTSALDVTVQAELLDILRTMATEHNLGILFITHDLAVVSEVSDTVAVMQGGRIVETGDTYSLLTHPNHPYTRALIEAIPVLSSE